MLKWLAVIQDLAYKNCWMSCPEIQKDGERQDYRRQEMQHDGCGGILFWSNGKDSLEGPKSQVEGLALGKRKNRSYIRGGKGDSGNFVCA